MFDRCWCSFVLLCRFSNVFYTLLLPSLPPHAVSPIGPKTPAMHVRKSGCETDPSRTSWCQTFRTAAAEACVGLEGGRGGQRGERMGGGHHDAPSFPHTPVEGAEIDRPTPPLKRIGVHYRCHTVIWPPSLPRSGLGGGGGAIAPPIGIGQTAMRSTDAGRYR